MESSSRSGHVGATDNQRSDECGSYNCIQAKQPYLIKRLTLFVVHLHRSPTFFQLFMTCSQLISMVQYALATVEFLVTSNKDRAGTREVQYIGGICSAFTRLVPFTESVITHEVAVLVTVVTSVMCVLLLLKTFLRVKASEAINLSSENFVTLFIIWLLRYLFPVSVSLFVNAVFSYYEAIAGLRMLLLSLLTFVICCIENFLANSIIDCYPGFVAAPGSFWGYGRPFGSAVRTVTFFALVEVGQHVSTFAVQISMGVFMFLLILISIISVIYYLPFTSVAFMEVTVGVLVWIDAVLLVFIASNSVETVHDVLLPALSGILPSFVISWILVSLAGSRAESLVLDSLNVEMEDDYRRMDVIKSPSRFMAVLCYCFRYQDDSFSLFEHALEQFPDDFEVVWIYAKIAAIHADRPELITRLLTEMEKRAGNSICNWLIVSLFAVLFVDELDYGAKTIRSVNACNKAVDDFFALLHLFWTEIHFGRSSRLSTLANEANMKYNKVRSLFARLFVKHAHEPAFKQSYQKFQSFVTVQVSRDRLKDFMFLPDIFLTDTIRLFNNEEQRKPLVDVNCMETKAVFSPAAAMLQDMNRTKLMVLGHITVWLPFYFCLFAGLVYASVLFSVHAKLQATWSLCFQTMRVTELVAATYMGLSFRSLSDAGLLDKPKVVRHIIDHWLFQTNMTDIDEDLMTLCTEIMSNTIDLSACINNCGFDESNNPAAKVYTLKAFTHTGTTGQSFTLIPMLFHFVVDIRGILNVGKIPANETWDALGGPRFENFQTLISALLNVVSDLHGNSHQRILDYENGIFNILTITIAVVGVCFLLLDCICYVLLLRTHSRVFEPFLLLPKTAISELLEELGDKIATDDNMADDLDAEQMCNFRQLSYPSPPSSYHTWKRLFFNYFVYCVIIIFIASVFWYEMRNMALTEIEGVRETISGIRIYLEVPYYIYMSGYTLAMSMMNEEYGLFDQDEYDKYIQETTTYFHDSVVMPMLNGSVFDDPVLNASGFLGKDICSTPSVTCLPRSYLLLSLITKTLATLENHTGPATDLTMTALILSASSMSPTLGLEVEHNFDMYNQDIIIRYTGAVIGFFALIVIIIVVSQFYIKSIVPPHDFSTAVLSSIPSCVFSDNEKVLDVIVPKSVDAGIGIDVLNLPTTCQFLLDMVFLVGHDDKIVAVTGNVPSKWNIDIMEIVHQDFRELLRRVCPDFRDDIELPPEAALTAKLKIETGSGILTAVAHFVPTTTFTFDGRQVSYAVTMQDVSYEEALIKKMNQEAGRLRLLMYRIVPKQVADSLLDTGTFNEFLVSKACIASFMIEGIDKIRFKDVITKLKKRINAIVEKKNAIMLGRSIQSFRVVCGIFNPDITIPQMAAEITTFCLYFMRKMKQFKRDENVPLDIFCTIHISGPLLADVVKDPLPVFDLFGSQRNVYQLISSKFGANKVCITKEMYDAMNYEEAFDLSFFTEIETGHGPPLELFVARNPRQETQLQQSSEEFESLIQFSTLGTYRTGSRMGAKFDEEREVSAEEESYSETGTSSRENVSEPEGEKSGSEAARDESTKAKEEESTKEKEEESKSETEGEESAKANEEESTKEKEEESKSETKEDESTKEKDEESNESEENASEDETEHESSHGDDETEGETHESEPTESSSDGDNSSSRSETETGQSSSESRETDESSASE